MKEIVAHLLELLLRYMPDFLSALLISGIVMLLFMLLRFVVLRLALLRIHDASSRLIWKRISGYVTFFTILVFLIPIWFPAIREMAAFLGIFGAGIIICFKEVILNMAGWFYIVIRRPFDPGNRIIVRGHIGDVIDIRLLEFSILEVRSRDKGGQSTGRVIHIPNSTVFQEPLGNSSKAFSFYWNEIDVPLTPGSDWQRAETLLLKIAARVIEGVSEGDSRIRYSRDEYAIRYHALTPSVYVEYRDRSVKLGLRYLCEPRQVRQVSDRIWREILRDFAAEPHIRLK